MLKTPLFPGNRRSGARPERRPERRREAAPQDPTGLQKEAATLIRQTALLSQGGERPRPWSDGSLMVN